jgi:hypothetical protein
MKFKVDEEIKKQTTGCTLDYACLTAGEEFLCPATGPVVGSPSYVVFIKCDKGDTCIYRSRFGNSYVCRCPVRAEIFRRYGK